MDEGPSWHPVSWLRRADRSSISSFHLADLGGKAIDIEVTQSLFPSLMLVDLSEPVSRGIGDDPRLIRATARENRPSDAGELVGERDCQHVAVQPLRCLLDPRPQAPHRRTWPPRQHDVCGLHEQCPQIFVAALGDLAQDRAIPGRLLPRYEPQPGAEVASLCEAGAITDRRHHGTRDDWPNPRHRHHPLATLILC